MQPNSHQHNESKIGVGEEGFQKFTLRLLALSIHLAPRKLESPLADQIIICTAVHCTETLCNPGTHELVLEYFILTFWFYREGFNLTPRLFLRKLEQGCEGQMWTDSWRQKKLKHETREWQCDLVFLWPHRCSWFFDQLNRW